MTRLASRLDRLEGELRRRRPTARVVMLYWNDELAPCHEHPHCYVEPESDRHHPEVVRLSFGASEMSTL